jgi:hypothetical protein
VADCERNHDALLMTAAALACAFVAADRRERHAVSV